MDKMALNEFCELIKTTRSQLGLSQFSLAAISNVSLPTIQNIEAGRANPSLEVILKLFKVLKIEIQFSLKKIDWDCLAQGGVPLTFTNHSNGSKKPPNKEEFETELKRAYLFLTRPQQEIDSEPPRNWEAFISYLWALSSHYPNAFYKIFKTDFSIDTYLEKYSYNKLIKLRRLALSQIKNY